MLHPLCRARSRADFHLGVDGNGVGLKPGPNSPLVARETGGSGRVIPLNLIRPDFDSASLGHMHPNLKIGYLFGKFELEHESRLRVSR